MLHTGYYLSLQSGYRAGDLSLVYPLARGTEPALAMVGAILILNERPSLLAIAGAALIAAAVLALAAEGARSRSERPASTKPVMLALLTGVFIASYSLWDKYSVSTLAVSPMLLIWVTAMGRSAILAPMMRTRRSAVRELWKSNHREIIGVAVLDPLAYLLVLIALTFTPVSYVAPAREISILFGILIGTRLLSEKNAGRRLSFGGAMVLGLMALALG
jgi:drug/metabolite transporter (DMT)-like permease